MATFSERYGYKKIDEKLYRENVPREVRQRLWNIFEVLVFMEIRENYRGGDIPSDITQKYISFLWDKFFKRSINDLLSRQHWNYRVDDMQKLFLGEFEWYKVYDFLEFFAENYSGGQRKTMILSEINRVFKEEKVPYRMIVSGDNYGQIIPLTSEEEIKEIEKALNTPDKYAPVREHLSKALNLLSDRKESDYPNSIKESISSLESLVQITLGEKGTLGNLIKGLNVHPALKQGFRNLYGWTSDDGGIRHGKTGESLDPEVEEARYMLVTTSAFINYVIAKEDKTKEP